MFVSVPTVPKSLEDYRPVVGDAAIDEIHELAAQLRGARVLQVNATAYGGGVAEILATTVSLLNDIGLSTDWQVIRGADEFFTVTKAMHNGLQGMPVPWTSKTRDIWLKYNEMNAEMVDDDYDFVVIHDPQPAGILQMSQAHRRRHGKWMWRCHIDLTEAQPDIWSFLRPYVEDYDGAIFTIQEFVKKDLGGPRVFLIPPAIDPLSPKNSPIPETLVKGVLDRYGVDTTRPIICQVSRFDPWKDPLGVIDAYRLVKHRIPEVQLVMIASMAADDPEGWSYYERTARRAGEDFDIHLLSNLNGVGNIEVNAFQQASSIVVQKSIREGFGLVVAEALWKGKPVVAGKAGGIPLQVMNGQTGYLIESTVECAERIIELLEHPELGSSLGKAGREHVRRHFLTTRGIRDYLKMFLALKNGAADLGNGAAVLGAPSQAHAPRSAQV